MDINDPNSKLGISIPTKSIDHSQTIITLIEDHLDIDKKMLISKLNIQEKKQAEIERIAKELKTDINNLEQTIKNILDKHHKDYISTFSAFMDTVRKDLKLKLEQMEAIEEEKRKINDVNIIRCERDYFRSESIKLNNLNKDLHLKIDDMGLRMKILSDEVNNITIKWKESESANRQLLVELEGNIQSHKQLESELIQMKQNYFKASDQHNNKQQQQTQLHQENEGSDDDFNKGQLIMLIERLKVEIKKEKNRNNRIQSILNSIVIEKNKLENIFIDCVEETRKTIFNRRLKGNINSKVRRVDDKSSIEINSKYDSFLPADKKDILEHFVFNDEVSNVIREAMFTKPQNHLQIMQSDKNAKERLNKSGFGIRDNYANKEDKMGQTTNIIDNTRTTFFKTGRLTMTTFQPTHGNKGLSLPLQIKK